MDLKISHEKIRGLIIFLSPTFFITVTVIAFCVYGLRPLSLSPLFKTAITVLLSLGAIFSCALVVHKRADASKHDG
jgi:hypothetical protein